MGPLEGIRVLDLSRFPPGRYCSMILGDLGAEVIMVDAPKGVSQAFDPLIDDTSSLFVGQSRSKKSIALDFKTDEGKHIFHRLIEKSDVMIEGNLPGVLAKRGLDYDSLSRINSRLVYCSITAYGQDGPYAHRSAHEINIAAATALLGAAACEGGPPTYTQSPAIGGSLGGTTQAAIAIIAALFSREKTGRGQYIDVSMTDGALFYNWLDGPEYLLQAKVFLPPAVSPTGSDMAWLNVYKAKDGRYLAVCCTESWRWANLCRLAGRDEYLPHHFSPVEKQKEMYDGFSEVFATRDRDEWVDLLDGSGVTVSPVHDLAGLFSDPHFQHRGVVVEVDHPKLGRIKLLNTPFKLSETPARVTARPPLWAEHTREVLGTLLGCTEKELDRLVEQRIIE